MSNSNAPQLEVFSDEHEEHGYELFKKFENTPESIDFLLEAAHAYEQSSNPDGKTIAKLFTAIYLWKKSQEEKDSSKAIPLLQEAREAIKVVDPNGDQAKIIELEYLSRQLSLFPRIRPSNPERLEWLQKRSELYKEMGRDKSYHGDLAIYYMFLFMDAADEENEQKALEYGQLMIEHGDQSEEEQIMYKVRALFSQFKAANSHSFVDSLPDLEDALTAVEKTEDHYGEKELRNRVTFARAMLTKDKDKRTEKLIGVAEEWRSLGDHTQAMDVLNLVTPFPIKTAFVISKIDEGLENQKKLNTTLHGLLAPFPSGPYALFYHSASVDERLNDLKMILTRLGDNKTKLKELAIEEAPYRAKSTESGKEFPSELRDIFKKQDELGKQMRLDMESLYIFGNMLLDQWAYMIGYLSGHPDPKTLSYHALVELLQSKAGGGILTPLWEHHKEDIIWLYYHLRFYRNIFIEHVRRPWQKGTTMSSYGDEFNFFICTPPGWISDEYIEQQIDSIKEFAPDALLNAPDDYWEKARPRRYLEVTFNHIDKIEMQVDRDKVYSVWTQIGGSTAPYYVIAHRLARMVCDSFPVLEKVISENTEKINLGKPPAQ